MDITPARNRRAEALILAIDYHGKQDTHADSGNVVATAQSFLDFLTSGDING